MKTSKNVLIKKEMNLSAVDAGLPNHWRYSFKTKNLLFGIMEQMLKAEMDELLGY